MSIASPSRHTVAEPMQAFKANSSRSIGRTSASSSRGKRATEPCSVQRVAAGYCSTLHRASRRNIPIRRGRSRKQFAALSNKCGDPASIQLRRIRTNDGGPDGTLLFVGMAAPGTDVLGFPVHVPSGLSANRRSKIARTKAASVFLLPFSEPRRGRCAALFDDHLLLGRSTFLSRAACAWRSE